MPPTSEPGPTDPTAQYERLISIHKAKIDEVLREIYSTIVKDDFNQTDPRCAGILRAKNDQLEELENQLRVYETVMGRARDPHLGKRESYRFSGRLPAFGKRCEIDEYVNKFDCSNRFLIVQGQTGSGKSTQLPQYIADHPRMAGKIVICTQPRKIAAVSLAERVTLEYAYGNRKSKVGYQVGYSVGGSKPKFQKGTTRIEFMTEGKMLERLMNRRTEDFKNIGAIIIDEAHERSIVCDILLGTLKKSDPLWDDILLVVSSATIDLVAFDKFFSHHARIIEIAGRMYPVERIYRPLTGGSCSLAEQGDIIKAVAQTALNIHHSTEDSGDILCFLPGADEVHRGALWFAEHLRENRDLLTAKVYELYGAQDAEEQRKVFEEWDPQKYRKVIFATDIAETSITINGVVYVVDSGVKKEMTFDPKRNISSLKTINISQSSSLQREGRAGRTQPGVCYKLYSEEDFESMNVNTLPEIFRRPLPLAILYLRKMGVDPVRFDWVSAPDPEAIKSAEDELIVLGAIDSNNKQPTTLGGLVSHSQQDPKTVRMIYNGMLQGFGMVAIKMAALLSVSSSFFFYGGKGADAKTKTKLNEKRKLLQHEDGDILTMLKLYTTYESLAEGEDGTQLNFNQVKKIQSDWIKDNSLNGKAIKTAKSIVRDLKYIFSNTKHWDKEESQCLTPTDEEVLRLFCSGYFLHAARRVNVKGKGQSRLNYFAMEPEVVGSLHFSASLNQAADGGIPEWIIFDQILKFSDVTVFPASSRIDFNWIHNESQEFYLTCNLKERKLPTEVVEINASDTVLRTIFGKRFMNLSRFEDELDCSIIADLAAGLLRAICSKISRANVEVFLNGEVNRAKEVINKETREVTWRCNTRLVIGPGYEVSSVLFPREFNTIYIRNLRRECTRNELEHFIYSLVDDRDKVSSIQFIPQDRSCMGIVKLSKPSDAPCLLNKLKEEVDEDESGISVAPHTGDVSTGSVPKGEEVKLKISWPLGYSKGEATIVVETCEDGNRVIGLIPMRFSGARANAIGDTNLTDFRNKKPKVVKARGQPYKFCEATIYEVEPIYKVKVKGLSLLVDEFQIIEQLRNFGVTPLRVFVDRRDIPQNRPSQSTMERERESKLLPFRSTSIGFDRDIVATDFFDKASGRAGVSVYHPDKAAVEEIFPKLKGIYGRMKAYDHPYRVELERTFTFSVHMDLYKCLKPKFKKTLADIRNWNVWASETGPGTGNKRDQATEKKRKFVYIRLRHGDANMIRRCRLILEKIVERESLDADSSPKVGNLFTWTGKLLLKERIQTSDDYYIHWDNRNHHVHVYGKDPHSRNEVIRVLKGIIDLIEKWKVAGFFEKVVMLDRKALEIAQKRNATFIDTLCRNFRFVTGQYHLVGRNKLVVSASSSEEFQKFEKHLEAKDLKMSETKKTSPMARDCGLCLCEIDSDFMVMSICNHAFCMECIKGMITSSDGVQKLPLCCPADNCERRLPIQDTMKIVPPHAISKLNETSLDIYLRPENNSGLKYCPKPGCNQIFRPKIGGEGPTFYACDNCLSDFCLECTEFLRKEVGAHAGRSCESVRLGENDQIWKYMNQIRDEILNLRCPRCKTPFYDYEGCAALTCGRCQGSFCALCLEDCGSNSHPHVLRCRYNQTGGYYHGPTSTSVQRGNRLYRIDKLKEFFRNTSDLQTSPDLESKLLTALERDLKDLGINITDIKVHTRRENPTQSLSSGEILGLARPNNAFRRDEPGPVRPHNALPFRREPDLAQPDIALPNFRREPYPVRPNYPLPNFRREPNLARPGNALPNVRREPYQVQPDFALPNFRREPNLARPDIALPHLRREPNLAQPPIVRPNLVPERQRRRDCVIL